MKATGLVLWTQDNTLSVKFYKKLGFTVTESTDAASVVELGGFQIMWATGKIVEVFRLFYLCNLQLG